MTTRKPRKTPLWHHALVRIAAALEDQNAPPRMGHGVGNRIADMQEAIAGRNGRLEKITDALCRIADALEHRDHDHIRYDEREECAKIAENIDIDQVTGVLIARKIRGLP